MAAAKGAEVHFRWPAARQAITVFTTRPDTLFGATYMVLSPEHKLVEAITTPEQRAAVAPTRPKCRQKERPGTHGTAREKTGVFTGAFAINPVNNEKIPIWIADYVLASYGTGAIMAVPAHDERDLEFARKFDLPIRIVVQAPDGQESIGFVGDGIERQFRIFSPACPRRRPRRKSPPGWRRRKLGRKTVNYKLRDWLFSRQRYWGEPFPIVWKPTPTERFITRRCPNPLCRCCRRT